MNGPTPEDMARDLAADLKVCDAATTGPWYVWTSSVSSCSGPAPHGNVQGPRRVQLDRGQAFVPDDATFIAAAREIAPAAIRRALAAEALLRRLVAAEGWVDSGSAFCEEALQILDEAGALLTPPSPPGP